MSKRNENCSYIFGNDRDSADSNRVQWIEWIDRRWTDGRTDGRRSGRTTSTATNIDNKRRVQSTQRLDFSLFIFLKMCVKMFFSKEAETGFLCTNPETVDADEDDYYNKHPQRWRAATTTTTTKNRKNIEKFLRPELHKSIFSLGIFIKRYGSLRTQT